MRKELVQFAFIVVCFYPELLSAQLMVDKVIPPSPNAAALIKYCDHPPEISSGIPEIKIPLRNLVDDDLFIPINLNYHALGIRVEEEATWTGLGWYLSVGGMITRIVRGENDFGYAEKHIESEALGYPFEHIKPCFDDCENNDNNDFFEKVCNGEIDSDPDIFFFDILGQRGKFLMTPDHETSVESITIDMTTPQQHRFEFMIRTNTWKVKDKRGYAYYFKSKENTETHRNYFNHNSKMHKVLFGYHSDQATTTWYLDQVISPSGKVATFEYVGIEADGAIYGSNSTHHKMNINDEDIWDVHYSSKCFSDTLENIQILSENIFSDVYLNSVKLGEYHVSLTTSDRKDIISAAFKDRPRPDGSDYSSYEHVTHGPQKLDVLEVRKNHQVVDRWRFNYSYFNANTNDRIPRLYKRLRLDSLTKVDISGKKKTTKFYYHSMELPSKESHARDLWGFFNGEEDLYNITPSDYFNYSQPEKGFNNERSIKHYDPNKLRASTLSSIEYGSGFTREFFYESQVFTEIDNEIEAYLEADLKWDQTDQFVSGGLRVKEIIQSFPSEKIYQEFNFKNDQKETGVLTITPYSHRHNGYGHKTSGNHAVKYNRTIVKSGKLFRGIKF